jgi:hypothetical protein
MKQEVRRTVIGEVCIVSPRMTTKKQVAAFWELVGQSDFITLCNRFDYDSLGVVLHIESIKHEGIGNPHWYAKFDCGGALLDGKRTISIGWSFPVSWLKEK